MFRVEINKIPPSVNHYWVQTKNYKFLSKKGRMFKEELGLLAKKVIKKPLIGKVKLNVLVVLADKRRRDVDNFLKPILDGLNKIAYLDDSQVYELTVSKTISQTKSQKTIIEVCELDD